MCKKWIMLSNFHQEFVSDISCNLKYALALFIWKTRDRAEEVFLHRLTSAVPVPIEVETLHLLSVIDALLQKPEHDGVEPSDTPSRLRPSWSKCPSFLICIVTYESSCSTMSFGWVRWTSNPPLKNANWKWYILNRVGLVAGDHLLSEIIRCYRNAEVRCQITNDLQHINDGRREVEANFMKFTVHLLTFALDSE